MAEIKEQFLSLTVYTGKIPPLVHNYNSFLLENFKIFNKKKGGFFSSMFKGKDTEEKHDISFFDPRSGKTVTKKVNYYQFMSSISETMQVLVQLNNKESDKYRQIEKAGVDSVWNFFFELYFDIYTLKEKCIGFENLLMSGLKNAFKNETEMKTYKEALEKLITALYNKQVEISDQL